MASKVSVILNDQKSLNLQKCNQLGEFINRTTAAGSYNLHICTSQMLNLNRGRDTVTFRFEATSFSQSFMLYLCFAATTHASSFETATKTKQRGFDHQKTEIGHLNLPELGLDVVDVPGTPPHPYPCGRYHLENYFCAKAGIFFFLTWTKLL